MTPSAAADGAPAPSALLEPPGDGEPRPETTAEDQDTGDLQPGVDEDALNDDALDTDRIASRE